MTWTTSIIILYLEHLILPPAMQPVGPNRDLRVIGHHDIHKHPVGEKHKARKKTIPH
ncbi:hypothetical protein DAPPUDRAFT_251000 [Daphnia pulex]|uniref:Uncharacterized protein n=1 Tax=Daphnia pulex TaxID=6669 RepID=E9GZK5_DAPPU|nr:hypothetical protein DAPPUDRAFT_251000 [Daphnia pulex]|eukprot:EFX75011.1 hypothetical protein DAPPUDRAFT_251000 [Daphnia pulex]